MSRPWSHAPRSAEPEGARRARGHRLAARGLGLLGLVYLLGTIALLVSGATASPEAFAEPSPRATAAATAGPDGDGSPTPSPAPSPDPVTSHVLEPVDPRSEGSGPGIVGSPLVILLGVVGLGILSALITAAWVRLTRQD